MINGHNLTHEQELDWLMRVANAYPVPTYPLGPNSVRKVTMSKLNGGAVEVKVGDITLTIYRPIPTRPKVIRIVTDDGRQSTIGDHQGFNSEEIGQLQTIISPEHTSWKLYLEDKERKQLAEAEADLQSARALVQEDGEALDRARAALHRHLAEQDRCIGNDSYDPDKVDNQAKLLDQEVEEANRNYREARNLEQFAFTALNKTKQHLSRVARRRSPEYQPTFVPAASADESTWRQKLREARK